MTLATLKEVTEELGLSPDDPVHFYRKGNKGIIEVTLAPSDREIELSALNDASEDFLSVEELDYYLKLEDK